MGRGRGKGKKQTVIASHDDPGSAEEEKIPAFRRRGRPAKPQKDDIAEDAEKKEDTGDQKDFVVNKDVKNLINTDNGKKRKRPVNAKENEDSMKEENGIGNNLSTNDSIKNAGFRQNNSRRKNPPRRAAEVGVECK